MPLFCYLCIQPESWSGTKGAGIELTILVNIFVLKLATHAHNANREMNFFNLIGGYFLGELS